MAGAQQGRYGCGRHAQRGRGGSHGFRAPRAPRQHGGPGLLGANPSSQPPAQVQPPVPVPLPSEKRDPTPLPPASSSPSSHVKAPPVSDPVKNYNGDGGITAVAKMDDDAQDDVLVGLSGSSTAATGKKRFLPLHNDEEAEDASKKKIRLAWGEGLAKYENRQYKDDETTHKLVAHDGATGQTASSHGSSPPAGSKGHCDNNSLDHMAKIRVSHVTTAPGLFSKGSSTLPRTGDLSDPGKKESISSLTNKEVVSPAGYIGDLPIIFPKVFAVPRKGSPPPEDNSSSSSGKTPIALSAFASSTQGCDAPPDESSMEFMKVQDAQKCLPTTVMESQENCPNENDAAPLLSGIATIKVTKNFERTKAKEEDVKKPVNQILHESTANLLAHSLPDKGHGESSMDENEHVTGKVLVGESNAAPSSLAMKSSHSDCLTISEIEAPVLENFNEDSCPNEAVCITKSSSMVMENVPQSVLIANHGDEGNCVAGGSCGQDNLKITFFPDERSAKPASGTIEGDQIRSGAKTVELCSSMKERNDAAKHHSWKETEKKLANSNIDDGKMAPSDMKRPNSKDNPCITSDPAAILTGPAFVQHMMELDEADESSMKFMKVQDVPPRMEKLIVKMVQNRKITNNNIVLSDEPETDELRGSKLKEWSQEEKDVFSEMIRTFGLNFSKVSSFLTHKTTADCMKYYSEHYKSECHKEAQKCLPTTVMQSQGNYSNENDAAHLLSGIETIKATKNSERMKAKEEVKKPVNKISHESTASLLAHSLRDKGHGESSMDENEHLTGKVVLGESNAAASALGMRSSQAACLTISKTEAPVLENFNEDSCSNKAVCITKSSSKVNENEPQSVLIANHGDEGNCVAGGSCGHDTLKTTFFPDERSAKLAKGTIKGDQIRSGAKTAELCSSLKECNDAAKHHSGEATEKKLANSNIDDGRVAPSDMKNPNSKVNPCITSDPAAILTGPAFVQHMMELDEAMEKKESEKNDDSVNGKEGNNPVLCVASKHGSGIQLSCEVNSQKEMEKVDSIPSPEGNDMSTDTETLTKDSGPRVATNDDGLIQRLRASEAMYRHPENNDAKVINNKENPVHSVALKESNGIQLSCDVTAKKGKGIIPSPEVNDLNAPPMQISYGAPNTYHLPSSSGSAALDMVHANSSYAAMDIDLNIPLDMTPTDVTSVDLRSSTAEAAMGCRSEATDSHTTMEITQTYQQQPASANQPGSVLLFGTVIYQAPPSTGTVVTSRNAVVPVIRPRGRGQAYASWATTTTIWRNSIPYGRSTSGASRSAAPPLQLQHGSSASALINMMNQQRQQDLANITPISIVRGGVPVVHSLIPGSSGGARFVNFNGFNSVQPQWPYPVVGTSRVVIGHPFYYPGATANQAPATVTTILSIGTNNGEGGSTSNARAPPAAGRGRGRGGHNSWLSLRRN